MNAFCVKCQVELRPVKNGAIAVMMTEQHPVEIRSCDLYGCPDCGAQIGTAFALRPLHGPELTGGELAGKVDDLVARRAQIEPFWLNVKEREAARVKALAMPVKLQPAADALPAGGPVGGRNNAAAARIGKLLDALIDLQDVSALGIVLEGVIMWNERNHPPLPAAELTGIWEQTLRRKQQMRAMIPAGR